jgi:hypothetical protein
MFIIDELQRNRRSQTAAINSHAHSSSRIFSKTIETICQHLNYKADDARFCRLNSLRFVSDDLADRRPADLFHDCYLDCMMRAIIRPYSPSTSANIRIRIMPTNNLGCRQVPRTPESPTMPIASPAASPDMPTAMPAPSELKALWRRKKTVR